ncbi:hypothetical protein, partial [Polaromonas sp. YR568]|uniref:hypothetical protein n=1 Tax=Polaromonas sp. YR568 TaxID=1855301 RepID=UPI00398BEBA0
VLVTLVRSSGAIPWWQAAGFSFVCLLVWLAAGWFGVLQRGRGTGTAPTLAALLWWLVGGVVLVAAGLVCLHGSARWGQALVAGAMAGVSWAIVLPLGIALAVALCGWQFTTTLLSGLHANFWGLCSGRTQQPGDSITGLTDWLTGYFNDIAGLKAEARPLTLGDLWEGRQLSDEVALSMKDDKAPLDRAINFEVMTTAVSQQMCYAIPFRVGSGAFYFDEKEWARLFPASVIAWLVKASDAEKAASDAERKRSNPEWKGSKEVTTEEGTLLRRLPSNRNLPVVLLVRMSLSFPILLSAVPMYAVDHSSDKTKGHAKRVWFSDGGISSNMPLHFFDAPLPGHPTFAVNLKAEHPDYPIVKDAPACQEGNGRVYLAQDNNAGRQLYWEPPADGSPQGLFSFLASIVKTMQNWRDEIQFPYPGYRDRIVQISQRDDEGGLNLDMPDSHIKALGEAGECAAEKITARFKPDAAAGPAAGGWENHKRIRLRTFLALAEELCRHPSLRDSQWDAVLANGSSLRYNAKEQALARKILDDLRAIGTAAQDSGVSLAEKAPKPRASLRISPRI